VSVTPDSALTSAAVFACVRILAETVASLPLITYTRTAKGRDRATNFYLYPLLHDSPNEYMTSFELRETLQGHLALWGNAFSQLDYDAGGRITSIFPLRPDHMREIRVENGQKIYHYQLPNGQFVWLDGLKIWHLKAFGDGIWGYSPVELMRNAIGLNMALEKFGSKFFANGARPGGVLEHPGQLSDKAGKNLRASWNEMHSGLDNAHKIAILEEGLKWHDVGIPPEEAQFLETRKFQLTEIARIYRIPPHMIADLEKATFSNIEQQDLEFVKYTMFPWLTRWEQSIQKHLMLERERKKYYAEFLLDGLLRGDNASRSQYYAMAKQWGWMSTNEIRQKENMNPVEGGDVYLIPMNMMPADQVTTPPAPAQGQNQEPPRHGEHGEEQREAEEIRAEMARNEERALREERGNSFASKRHRVMEGYKPLYADKVRGILKKESRDVGAAVRRTLKDSGWAGLKKWMESYYETHADQIKEQMMPLGRSYGQQVADLAAQELNDEPPDESVGKFTESYVGGYAARHTAISQSKVEQKYMKAIAEETDAEEALLNELELWPDERSPQIADEESVRFGNAMAKMVYGALGVVTLRFVTFGENCPYCDQMDGRVIGIEENFISAGGSLEADGAEPLTSTTDIGHPPIHNGCDCMIVAG
jgi:HK97 family phage portal protein